MTEFYTSLKPDEDKKRMFDSWPKTLTLRFIARRKGYKKFQRVQYTEALKKIIQELIGEEERLMEAYSAEVPPAEFLAGDKIDLLVVRGLEQIEKISERIKYKLCQETFQNLLMGNEYHSYYKASREEKLDNELEPVVRAMYESIKEIYEDSNLSQANKIFYLLNENLCRIQSEEGISELVARYIEMFSVIFDLPEDIFEYGESEEEFYFTLAGQTAENQKKFSDFLVAYKKIVMPYAFLEFEWGMSSGENNLLNFYSKLFAMRNVINGTNFHKEEIVNYISKFPENNRKECDCIRCRSLWLLIDEMDLTYHPRWQKKLIADLTYFLPKILPDDELRIQIIFTTHSPILLGDIPKENVIYLKAENGKIDVKRDFSKNTFGQNIYVLFQDSFFLDEPLGKFSADKLQGLLTEIVDIRNKIDKISEKNKKGNPKKIKKLLNSISHIREESRIFGDKVIQYKLLELLDVCEYRLELIQQKAALSDSEEKEQTLERMRQKKMWLEQCIAEMENDEK